ncbi:MAG: hypothetical protein R6U32_04775 [Candidatus Woesearchaeota archaeon]
MTVSNAHDKALQIVRMKGPVVPSQINKELDTNIMFTSAILGELVSKNMLKISSIKSGGSPLYYYPGQENKLEQYAENLHPKEKEAFDLLKEKRILRDEKQAPAVRAALRQLKDFAKPLQVTINNTNHIFWKWYAVPNEEAEKTIRDMMGITDRERPSNEGNHSRNTDENLKNRQTDSQGGPAVKDEENDDRKSMMDNKRESPQPSKDNETNNQEPAKKTEAKNIEEKKKDVQSSLGQKAYSGDENDNAKKEAKPKEGKECEDAGEPDDSFFRRIKKYFDDNSIEMLDFNIIRKESDIEFTVKIPSPVGTLTYFCKAKNKKKVNDGDLSSVYISAQSKKLPVFFITTGELTKKAEKLLENEFKNMSLKKI